MRAFLSIACSFHSCVDESEPHGKRNRAADTGFSEQRKHNSTTQVHLWPVITLSKTLQNKFTKTVCGKRPEPGLFRKSVHFLC
mmetsp:Transcript_2418/g.16284  ORF Transcript_2418/g.16284 Transcript_2418/m.16284 type:complete len:83 (-) Transcript_2418:968-1216(-)